MSMASLIFIVVGFILLASILVLGGLIVAKVIENRKQDRSEG